METHENKFFKNLTLGSGNITSLDLSGCTRIVFSVTSGGYTLNSNVDIVPLISGCVDSMTIPLSFSGTGADGTAYKIWCYVLFADKSAHTMGKRLWYVKYFYPRN